MKILKPFCIFILCSIMNTAYSQDGICGAVDAPSNRINQELMVMSRGNSTVCVNVFFHIVRNDNGTGGFNVGDLTQIIQRLNLRYNKHGIFIKKSGHDFIDSTEFFDIENDTEANLLDDVNLQQNAINFYLVNSAPWGGRALRPSNQMIVVNQNALISTSEHELGHCFGLMHTHDIDNGVEHIQRIGNGVNCTTAGDGLCTTPADPGLAYTVNNVTYYEVDVYCNYTGNEPDPFPGGNLSYEPDGNNIMSYSKPSCRVRFVDDQGDLM